MSLIDNMMSRIGWQKISEEASSGNACGCELNIQDGKIVGTPYPDFKTNIKRAALSPSEMDAAYKHVACVGSSIDLIANNIQMIQPVFFDEENREFLEYPADKRLRNLRNIFEKPNAVDNRKIFLTKTVKSYILHGVAYFAIIFDGIKPLSIKVIDQNLVSPFEDVTNCRIDNYNITNCGIFTGQYKFTGSYYQHVENPNIILAPYINPAPDCSYLPCSILEGAGLEALMYHYGCFHNKSLLQNGARPSLIFLIKSLLNPKHREQLREEIRVRHSGAGNAGNAIIIDGAADKDIKQFSQNNKDMEFAEVLQAAEDAIYKRLGTNWVLGKNIQSKDLSKGMELLYDMMICPLFQGIYNHLFDVYKYKNSGAEKYTVYYLEQDIPALRSRFLQMMKDMPSLGIFTVEERRKMYNYQPLGDERDKELTVQSVKVTQSGMSGTNNTEFSEQ